jgi:hypothetical protein
MAPPLPIIKGGGGKVVGSNPMGCVCRLTYPKERDREGDQLASRKFLSDEHYLLTKQL